MAEDGLKIMKLITGTGALEAVGRALGETANKEIMKVVAHTGGHVLSGVLHGVIGGAVMLVDIYHLKHAVEALADGSEEGAQQIREIADQLEQALSQIKAGPQQKIVDTELN